MNRISSRASRPAVWMVGLLCAVTAVATDTNAQTAHLTYAQSTIASGRMPFGLAIDGNGNVYFTDGLNNLLVKETLSGGSYTESTILSGLSGPDGVAVDASGNVYVADTPNGSILKLTPSAGGYTHSTILNGLDYPSALAVDGNGNLYISEGGNGDVLKETLSGASYIPSTVTSGLLLPDALAVDGSGNVYVADTGHSLVFKETLSGGVYSQISIGTGLAGPDGLAVDSRGNLYISNSNGIVLQETPSGDDYTQSTVVGGLDYADGIAVDAMGNLFVADRNGYRVLKEQPAAGTFPSVATGTTSTAISLTFAFDTGGNIGAPAVLTEGAMELDFADNGTGSCTANGPNHTYNAGDTCTVDVSFSPKFAALRRGAAELTNSSGVVVATAFISGTGTGPQLAFGPGAMNTVGGGFVGAQGVAVDGKGNIYVADSTNTAVKEVPQACSSASCVTTLGGGFSGPFAVAVDGGGNIYVAEYWDDSVKKMSPGCASVSCVTTVYGGFWGPQGVAVDGAGNIYVADSLYNAVEQIPPGCTSTNCMTNLGGGFQAPGGVAVDGSGNVYVSETADGAIRKMPPGCKSASCVTTLGGPLRSPRALAVEASGDVYVAEAGNNAVRKIPAGCASSDCVTTVAIGLFNPDGIALDGEGNIYIADTNHNLVKEINRADPPSLVFAATPVGSTSSDSPQSLALQNIGNAALAGSIDSISANFAQVDGSGTPADCAGTFSLNSGQQCSLSLSFTPESAGDISGLALLHTNSLNTTGSETKIALSGTGLQATATLTLGNLSRSYTGSPLPVTVITSPANLAVGITYNGAATPPTAVGSYTVVATINDPNYTGTTTGTLVISPATATITLGNLAQVYTGSPLSVTATTVPASQPVTITYNGSTTAPTRAGSYAVVATLTNGGNYSGTTTGTLIVNKATPSITWPAPPAISYGTALSAIQLNAASNVPGGFVYNPGSGTVPGVGTQTISATFTPTDTTDYNTITSSVPLIVSKSSQSINFAPIAAQKAGGTVGLSATATSGLTVSFASATPTICSVSGTTATMLSAGTCTIQATQAGNVNYAAANPTSVSFTVTSSSSFKLITTPNSETIRRGDLAAFLLEAQSENGFSGTVKITCSGGPSASVCGSFPQALKLQPNRLALALSGILFPKNTTPGTYTLTFTGTSGPTVVSTTAQFTVKQ